MYRTPTLKAFQTSFDYPVAKIMYTTNAVKAVNSSCLKVIKKGAFLNENAPLKLLYSRITKLDKKMDAQQDCEGQWL